MWLSETRRTRDDTGPAAELGVVTLEGERPGVYLSGERRNLPVMGPGGYCWRPAAGQRVLVIKAGAEGETPCVAGIPCGMPEELEAGDAGIYAGSAAVVVKADGTVDLRGNVTLNGVALAELFAPRVQEEGESE